jgi:hypothetical protein
VDAIFKAAAAAASAARLPLACMAVEETGMGLMEDKVCVMGRPGSDRGREGQRRRNPLGLPTKSV